MPGLNHARMNARKMDGIGKVTKLTGEMYIFLQGFSTDVHSNLDEMIPRSDIKLRWNYYK